MQEQQESVSTGARTEEAFGPVDGLRAPSVRLQIAQIQPSNEARICGRRRARNQRTAQLHWHFHSGKPTHLSESWSIYDT